MTTKCWLACLLMWGGATALAAPPPRAQVTADPNDPEKERAVVSREEREKLGLTPRTWTGVVQSEVYTSLERLNKTAEALAKKKEVQAIQTLRRMRFRGTVYVQVQLKDIDAQRRVLASLKASECHAPFLFEKVPGLTAYITKDGLDKLAKNAEVVGICLDDKPLAEKPKTIFKDDLPPAKPEEAANEPGVAEGKVDPDVYRALATSKRVDVRISLRTDTLPNAASLPSDLLARNQARDRAEKELQDKVLSTVNADEFWLWTRLGSGMSGFINREGLQKLWTHPDVQRISLKPLFRIPEHNLTPQ